MTLPLRRLVLVAFLAAAGLLDLAPRAAHAFCVNYCDNVYVWEYVNEQTGHYLLLPAYNASVDPEVTFVESGGAGPGWQRTGNDFVTFLGAAEPVCRFYSRGFNTHFYTANAGECAALKSDPAWIYEKQPFSVVTPSSTACSSGYVPIHRLASAAADHRYTADGAIRQQMIDRGWVDEGIAFCARSGGREPVKSLYVNGMFTACPSSFGAPCTALDALAPMANRVPPYLPPNYISINPAFPASAGALTGIGPGYLQDIYTAQADPSTITQHSFAFSTGGVFINGRDRTGGDYAGISPTLALPRDDSASGDSRVFVWRTASDRELRVTAKVRLGLVAQDGPGSHAYGHPLLEFVDARSGHGFIVTVQAFGTVRPGDFVGRDARTGEAIVSTVFRADPEFGRVLDGSFVPCAAAACAAAQSSATPLSYVFSLARADFQTALALARAADPALSASPADYFLARLAFHNETYLDARLGVTVDWLQADIWYVE